MTVNEFNITTGHVIVIGHEFHMSWPGPTALDDEVTVFCSNDAISGAILTHGGNHGILTLGWSEPANRFTFNSPYFAPGTTMNLTYLLSNNVGATIDTGGVNGVIWQPTYWPGTNLLNFQWRDTCDVWFRVGMG